jgi:NAD(P)H-dependent FMN reductase
MRYTIISGTDRAGSNTLRVSRQMRDMLESKGVTATLVSLEGIGLDWKSEMLVRLEEEVLVPTTHFLIVAPEYNGSFPGCLKTVIDLSDIRKVWWGKKAMLTGVSTGRAGNLRGMEHLTGVLNYLKVTVHPNRLPISVVDKLMDADGRIRDEATLAALHAQLDEYLRF